MPLKNFESYLNRPFEKFEPKQIESFGSILNSFHRAGRELYHQESDTIAFLSSHEDTWMKTLIEERNKGYKLFWLFDLPLRKTKNVLQCLIPESMVKKYDLQNKYNVCIHFTKSKKAYTIYKSKEGIKAIWTFIQIDDFDVVNQIKLRTMSSQESRDAVKVRREVLFDNPDIDTTPHAEMSILVSMFLSPNIHLRSGIESNSFLDNSIIGRELSNLDNYNELMECIVPPELSNSHLGRLRGGMVPLRLDTYAEWFNINPQYHTANHNFNAEYSPFKKEDDLVFMRNLPNTEIGINHQTKFKLFASRKDIIDKIMASEFFYHQLRMPQFRTVDFGRYIKIIEDNKDKLYSDYAHRMIKPLHIAPLSVSEKHKVYEITEDFCKELGYVKKQGSDSYFNAIASSVMSNLHRVKAVIARSGIPTHNLGEDYLRFLKWNFEEVLECDGYANLPESKVDRHKITKLMNNPLRRVIISLLKKSGRTCLKTTILSETAILGHTYKDTIKEMDNLIKAGTIWQSKENLVHLLEERI